MCHLPKMTANEFTSTSLDLIKAFYRKHTFTFKIFICYIRPYGHYTFNVLNVKITYMKKYSVKLCKEYLYQTDKLHTTHW